MRMEQLISDTKQSIENLSQPNNIADLKNTAKNESNISPQKACLIEIYKTTLQRYENELQNINADIENLQQKFDNLEKQRKTQINPCEKERGKIQEKINNLVVLKLKPLCNIRNIITNLYNTINNYYYNKNDYYNLFEKYKNRINKFGIMLYITKYQKLSELSIKSHANI